MDCIVHGVAKSCTQLSDFHFHFTIATYARDQRAESFSFSEISQRIITFNLPTVTQYLNLPLFDITSVFTSQLGHILEPSQFYRRI